jgi:uncharacterized protein
MSNALRLAVISGFVERLSGKLGRTAVMKLTFFLQELKGAPLGYAYRLYTYGPYDAQVLSDLKVAESVGAVTSDQFEWQGGSGYALSTGQRSISLSSREKEAFGKLSEDMDWVAEEFGGLTATELELESTIYFVWKAERERCPNAESVATAVKSIKPHHSLERIRERMGRLKDRGFITLQ